MANVEIMHGQTEDVLATAFSPVVTISELIKNSSDACLHKKDQIKVIINTKQKTISITDNGKGFSLSDIEDLKKIGLSRKMRNENTLSAIGEPYAGSKGLGIVTAFNLCKELEIETYSHQDNAAYLISWKKGTSNIEHISIDPKEKSTTITLYGVSESDIAFINLAEEIQKLAMTTITYYQPSETLPSIILYKDDKHIPLHSDTSIDDIYNKNKTPSSGKNGYFVAKSHFAYADGKLTISYEDNEKGEFGFADEHIYLYKRETLEAFCHRYNANYVKIDDFYNEFKEGFEVDPFEGTYYIWRGKRDDTIANFPCGIRIYINNYGLYHYLSKNTDWLGHSEISQNIKATNVKLKNTYGLVHFKNYNEEKSQLKISKERNDFLETMAKKNFLHIMQKVVSGIVSSIDIAAKRKKKDNTHFKLRAHTKEIAPGATINIRDLIASSSPYADITVTPQNGIIYDESTGALTFPVEGNFKVSFEHNEETLSTLIIVKHPIPNFSLKKQNAKITEGATPNLRDYVNKGSLNHASIDEIKISCDTATLKHDILSPRAHIGRHTIEYCLLKNDIELRHFLELEIIQRHAANALKLKKLFGNYKDITNPIKIIDIIEGIATCYIEHPLLSACGLRALLDISTRAFKGIVLKEGYGRDDDSILSRVDHIYNMAHARHHEIDKEILDNYEERLKKSRSKTKKTIEALDLNGIIHGLDVFSNQSEIASAAKQCSVLLEFIFDSLIEKQKREDANAS